MFDPQNIVSLYNLIGEAICAVQHAEDALSHSIALKVDVKHPSRMKKIDADKALEKYRTFTLGQAVKRAKKEKLYSPEIFRDLEALSEERNWLIHRSIAHGRDVWESDPPWAVLFRRIKAISVAAKRIQISIEQDLIAYSESNGIDMSKVKAEIARHRGGSRQE